MMSRSWLSRTENNWIDHVPVSAGRGASVSRSQSCNKPWRTASPVYEGSPVVKGHRRTCHDCPPTPWRRRPHVGEASSKNRVESRLSSRGLHGAGRDSEERFYPIRRGRLHRALRARAMTKPHRECGECDRLQIEVVIQPGYKTQYICPGQ